MKKGTKTDMGEVIISLFDKEGYSVEESLKVLRDLIITGEETLLILEKEAKEDE